MEPEFVADEIMAAVLTNQEVLIIPKMFYTLITLKTYVYLLNNFFFNISQFCLFLSFRFDYSLNSFAENFFASKLYSNQCKLKKISINVRKKS